MRPNLAGVLAAVLPGRVVRLALTPEQGRAFRDPDGRLALDVVRHLLGARAASVPGPAPDSFPLTELTFQAVARKRGRTVGIKRARGLLRRLVAAGVLAPSGSYRQRYAVGGNSGFRVRLYRLGARVCGCAATRKRAIGRGRRVKRVRGPRWWAHPLFGDLYGLPPPQVSEKRAAKMRSLDEAKQGFRWVLGRNVAQAGQEPA